MKKVMELIGIGLEDIICQSNITEVLSYCDRGAILLLYRRDKSQRTESMNIQIRGRNFNDKGEAVSVMVGGFHVLTDDYWGDYLLFRLFCEKEKNYRPWKIMLEERKTEARPIVVVENPLHETLHLPGIWLD